MVTGERYQQARRRANAVFGWVDGESELYTNERDIKTLLSTAPGKQIEYGRFRKCGDWAAISVDLAIAAINFRPESDEWHWVVFRRTPDDLFILDPQAKRDKRRDFGKARLHKYLPIHAVAAKHTT